MPEAIEQTLPRRKGGLMKPHAPEVWQTIKEQYLSGVPIAEISKLTGIAQGSIRGKASLSGWVQVKRETSKTDALEAQSVIVRAKLAEELTQQAESLRDIPSRPGINNLLLRSQIATPIVQNAKTVFGWGEQTSNTLVNVSVLSECVLSDAQPIESAPIEVEPGLDQPEQSMLNPGPGGTEQKG